MENGNLVGNDNLVNGNGNVVNGNGNVAGNGNLVLGNGNVAGNENLVNGNGNLAGNGNVVAGNGNPVQEAGNGNLVAGNGNLVAGNGNPVQDAVGGVEIPAIHLLAVAAGILAAANMMAAGVDDVAEHPPAIEFGLAQIRNGLDQVLNLQAQIAQHLGANVTHADVLAVSERVHAIDAVLPQLSGGAELLVNIPIDGAAQIHDGLVQLMTSMIHIRDILIQYFTELGDHMLHNLVEPGMGEEEDEGEAEEGFLVGEEEDDLVEPGVGEEEDEGGAEEAFLAGEEDNFVVAEGDLDVAGPGGAHADFANPGAHDPRFINNGGGQNGGPQNGGGQD